MSFLAFALDNSGCIKRMRSLWLSIFVTIFKFNLFIRKVFDENNFIFCFSSMWMPCRCLIGIDYVYIY